MNKTLKVIFIAVAILFLGVFLTAPKTDCDVCSFKYEDRFIDGHEAFRIYEEACISYDKPWDSPDLPNITLNETFK